ncbi:GNAT family N-acetyltransferase [Rufibacter psychrotolerans]|uniref:GNAT family N-acetyltransferase n=1 Tax=Rufibacter psychrotolerans TaxID=2812556 RepID=UPI001967DA78|nr:GNAT family N-acetyltransferase [Rufibacter sp. SYSU D00308]
MNPIQYKPKDKDAFALEENGQRIAEMIVDINQGILSVYHTGVLESAQGRGLGTRLIDAMVAHAREHQLKVFTYCPFVKRHFQRHAYEYADVWQKEL